MLELKQITLRRGVKVLLEEASMRLDVGYKAGLIGRNGAGKTSLFKLIMRELHEDHGEFFVPNAWKIAHLAQELPETDELVLAYARSGDTQWVEIQEKLLIAEKNNDGLMLGTLYGDLDAIDGYRIDARVAVILNGLGFPEDQFERPVKSFSGGWQMRLQLARVLMSNANLLLLDEPTNHLDLESIAWLTQWAKSCTATMVVISHDRYFLDEVTTHTIQLANQKLRLWNGNYSSFATQFSDSLLLQEKMNSKILKKRAHLQKFVDRFKATASKAKQAQSRVKAMEKMQKTTDWQEEESITFEFLEAKPTGYPTISIRANCGYGDKTILRNVSLNLSEGDRVGVIGVNGSGKSTLLKTISQKLGVTEGEINFHPQTQIGYFSQQQVDMLELEETPLYHFRERFADITETQARGFLGRFGFKGERVFDKVSVFSGGEKARLALALMIWSRPNVLLLDEPTNHLDMHIRESLIMALEEFTGALLLVSHDRYFIECCVDSLWLVNNGTVVHYDGNLADYEASQLALLSPSANKKATPPKVLDKETKKEILQIERDVLALEKQLKKVEKELEDPSIYGNDKKEKLRELMQQQGEFKKEISAKEKEWVKLSES
ncbi:MAG: ABC-F family ATP-binding cassette domain-containing protein [Gammaproteobacteria bacterium]|nr:ABC-F family ATP-binding cassette domain-containing protein [Gammaproteobacteria bacterium]